METPNDDSNLDKYTQNKVEKEIQKLLDEKEVKIKWRKEMEQNEAIQTYFKSYSDSSVSSFVDSYINNKYLWYRFGAMYKRMADQSQSQWIEMAHDHLTVILQKKLFDLQCLWRAEQIKLEGIAICLDFVIWQRNIVNCPCIEPITENELELYQQFLAQANIGNHRYSEGDEWQDYETIKDQYQDEACAMPDWYEFHNLRTGNSKLVLLPNVRGDKEDFYTDLNHQNEEKLKIKIKKEQPITTENLDTRPPLSSHEKEFMSFFVKKFESKAFQIKHKYYTESKDSLDNLYYEEIFEELLNSNEVIPIKANVDFKEAILQAFNDYRCKKIIEHLPIAFEQYLFNIKMGFSIEEDKQFCSELRKRVVKRIIAGRVLNGEEPNLDF